MTARAATTALAMKEARLLAGMSTFWMGLVIAVALCTAWGWTLTPRWDSFTANAGMAALVLAGFLLLIAHLAASRDHRHGAVESAGTLPASARRRTVALLAFIPAAGVAGALAEGVEILALLRSWPAGDLDPWLLAVPVVVPMIGAALGLAVGRWLPSTPAGPLALFTATAALAMCPVLGSGPGDLPWLVFPVVLDGTVAPGVPRPTGWHVLYLVALLLAVVGASLLRHWRLWSTALVILALATAATAVGRQHADRPTALSPTAPTAERHHAARPTALATTAATATATDLATATADLAGSAAVRRQYAEPAAASRVGGAR